MVKRLTQSDQGSTKIINVTDPTSAQDAATKNYVDGLVPSQTGNSGKYLTTNGTATSWGTVSAGSPGGSTTQVQYNSSGAFAGNASLTFNSATRTVTIGDGTQAPGSGTGTLTLTTTTSSIVQITAVGSGGSLVIPATSDTLTGRATTDTLTNKRITKRVATTTSSATPTINTDTTDVFKITAQATAITSMTTNLTGTPSDRDQLWITIKDNGSSQTITWGAKFISSGVATLPTATPAGKKMTLGFTWDADVSAWVMLASDTVGY